MTREDAIDVITRHYPPENYTELREAIELAITELAKTPEPLTDREKRIFLTAMNREEKFCKHADEVCDMTYEDGLVRVCDRIRIKVKKALWSN